MISLPSRLSVVREHAGLVALLLVAAMAAAPEIGRSEPPVCSYQVINTYPHDDEAFTQGLLFDEGELFESTGLYGESSLRRVALETGQVLQSIELDAEFFGEGLAMWEDRLLQLTWREDTCFIWDAGTFVSGGSFAYTGSGWGLTHDGRELIMSDGSAVLTFRDPDTFAAVGSIEVVDGGSLVTFLNELEWIRGEVFANVFLTEMIARIDPDTGAVIAWIDLDGLLDPVPPGTDVLNGIAWDDAGERLFVTGKLWPSLFEIELVDCPEIRLFWDGFESGGLGRWAAQAKWTFVPHSGSTHAHASSVNPLASATFAAD